MSPANTRKTFDDKMSDSEIEETPNLTGVAEENSNDDDMPAPLLIEASNSGLIAKIMTVAILMGIWICAWFFGFGNQIEAFDRDYILQRETGIVLQIKDWMVNFISSIFDNNGYF